MLKSFQFSLSKSLYFSLIFDGYFCWTYKSGLDNFSFQGFENIPLTSVSEEKSLIIYTILPLYVMNCFSVTVLRFYLTLVLSSIIMIRLGVVFKKYFSCYSLLLGLCLLVFSCMTLYYRLLKLCTLFFQSFFLFQSFCFLLPCYKFTDPVFCYLQFAVKPIPWMFNFNIIFFISVISTWLFFLSFHFSAEIYLSGHFVFFFKSSNMFLIGTLTFLSTYIKYQGHVGIWLFLFPWLCITFFYLFVCVCLCVGHCRWCVYSVWIMFCFFL